MNNHEAVEKDKEAIYIGNIYTIEADLKLPLAGALGSVISWESSHPHLISPTGKVTRPRVDAGNREVTLTATITNGDVTDTRVFVCTVLELKSNVKILSVMPIAIEVALGEVVAYPAIAIVEREDNTYGTVAVTWDNAPDLSSLSVGVHEFTGPPVRGESGLIPRLTVNVVAEKHAENGKESITAEAFDLHDVTINSGIFYENKNRMEEFLLNVSDDSMLYNFKDAAGIPNGDAQPMLGWDAPECNLKGHTTGHYLSAIALAYAGATDKKEAFKKKIDYMCAELEHCQSVMEQSEKFAYGFLSGYPEEQFDKLEEYVVYPKIWAPYYTLHKIFAGLLDCYEYGHNKTALQIAEKLGLWVYNRLSKCSQEQLTKMWSMYIAGEFGGMNEVLARLYSITPRKEFITAARFFDNEKLFRPLESSINAIGGLHANQHVPQIIGALEIYEQTKDNRYYKIAENFWHYVTTSHIYNIGGAGEGEMFKYPDEIGGFLTEKTAESCVSYNMLKLSKQLFAYKQKPEYMDYFEKALCNHVIASHDQHGPTGGSTYFMPLLPGGQKKFDVKGNTCCHGTGLESHLRYQEAIYFHQGDTLFVNLYIPSTLDWKEKSIRVTQSGNYLADGQSVITISGSGAIDFKLRIPSWLNGVPEISTETPAIVTANNGWINISGDFNDGDTIIVRFPFTLRVEPTKDKPEIASVYYGPLVLVAESDDTEFIEIDSKKPIDEQFVKCGELEFKYNDLWVRPNYQVFDSAYHAYFKIR